MKQPLPLEICKKVTETLSVDGMYAVSVTIKFLPMNPPKSNAEKIHIADKNIRLQVKADEFARELRRHLFDQLRGVR